MDEDGAIGALDNNVLGESECERELESKVVVGAVVLVAMAIMVVGVRLRDRSTREKGVGNSLIVFNVVKPNCPRLF